MNRRDFIRAGTLAATTTVAARSLAAAAAPGVPVRVAQIGTAHPHAEEKWATARRLQDVFDCVGVWEPDPDRRAAASHRPEYEGVRWLREDEFRADASIEAVLVETELPDLLAMGRRCLETGRHLHLDKPPGVDLAGFTALQQRAAHDDRVLQMGYMFRYHPAFRFCLDAVRHGSLGRVYAIHGDIGKALDPERRPWLAEYYRGSMMLLGCHLLDPALAILGPPDRVNAFRRNSFPALAAFQDNEIAVLEYPHALATIRSMLAEVGGGNRRQFVVCGTNGTVTIEPLEPAQVHLALAQPAGNFSAGSHQIPLPEVTGRYDAMLRDFAGMIAGRASTAPEFTAEHDHMLHAVLLSAAGIRSTRNPT